MSVFLFTLVFISQRAGAKLAEFLAVGLDPLYYPSGNAISEDAVRNVSYHNRASTNHRLRTNTRTINHRCSYSDPGSASDANSSAQMNARADMRAVLDQALVVDTCRGINDHILADAGRGIHDRTGQYHGPAAHRSISSDKRPGMYDGGESKPFPPGKLRQL